MPPDHHTQNPQEERPAGAADPIRWCPRCSAALEDRQCKLVCDRCGFYLSCSDFY